MATAVAFARAGADVALLARNREGLEVAARAAAIHGRATHVIPADVSDRPALEAAVAQAVAALGGLDVLVSNHAGMVFGNFTDVEPADFDRTLDVTFTGAVNAIRAALPNLERTAGTIVVTGSIMTTVPLPTFSSYTAAKHALRGFVNTLRIELRTQGSPVTISMMHPGAVDTPLWDHVSSASDRRARNPPDLYSPEVMARAIVALAARPRAEFTVGGEGLGLQLAYAHARPVMDRVLALVSRFYSSSSDPAQPEGLVRARGGVGEGIAAGGRHGRPSLWAWLRLGRPYRRRGPGRG